MDDEGGSGRKRGGKRADASSSVRLFYRGKDPVWWRTTVNNSRQSGYGSTRSPWSDSRIFSSRTEGTLTGEETPRQESKAKISVWSMNLSRIEVDIYRPSNSRRCCSVTSFNGCLRSAESNAMFLPFFMPQIIIDHYPLARLGETRWTSLS